jgi:hypothetical protein
LIKWLNQGKWERPHDKMAVYTEILPGQKWGIRVLLFAHTARVEAIDGPKCSWYKPGPRLSTEVRLSRWEKLRGVKFEDKLRRAVEEKRAVAREENEKLALRERMYGSEDLSGSGSTAG